MRKNRIAPLAIMALMIAALLSGCRNQGEDKGGEQGSTSGQNTGMQDETKGSTSGQDILGIPDEMIPNNSNSEMGRYLESSIGLPENAGDFITVLLTKDFSLEIYMKMQKDGKHNYTSYVYENGTWKASPSAWLSGLDGYLGNVVLGQDGFRYAVMHDAAYSMSAIFRCTEPGGAAEQIKIPYMEEPYKVIEDTKLYPNIAELYILKDGTLAIQTVHNNYYSLYDPDGKELVQLETANDVMGSSQVYASANGNKFLYLNASGDGIEIYNHGNDATEQMIPLPDSMKTSNLTRLNLMEDGTIYSINSNGIHKLAAGGTLWETTVDGDLNTMGMPAANIAKFFTTLGEKEQYYVLYRSESTTQLKEYNFNDQISSVPSQRLTIYSLYESDTIRQAIAMLQAKNMDVKIDYTVAMQDAEAKTAPDDYIRAFNTELLSGSGADLLLLDGLPVDSYVEKGILADMSHILAPLVQSGELFPNLINPFFNGKFIYTAPIHYSVPLYIGDKNSLEGLNLNKLAELAETSDKPSFMEMTEEEWLRFFLYEQYDELFLEDGTLFQEKFKEFLTDLNAVARQYVKEETNIGNGGGQIERAYSAYSSFFIEYLKGMSNYVANEIASMSDLDTVTTVARASTAGYCPVGNSYIPNGLIGVNAASDKKELIDEFLTILFGKELQSFELYEGMPVNSEAFNKMAEKVVGSLISVSGPDTESFTIKESTVEERQQFKELVKNLTNPVRMQEAVAAMLIQEGKAYLTGDKGLEEAVSAAASKINIYVAE